MQPIKSFLLSIPALSVAVLGLVQAPAAIGQAAAAERLTWPTEFRPPDLSDRRRPDGRSRGGASRGGCDLPESHAPLTALVPSFLHADPTDDTSTTYEAVLTLTTDSHPDFWFYVPYTLDGRLDLEFVLQDIEGNTLYQTKFAPETNSSGILQVSLPETSPALATATPYRWFFVAYCDPNAPAFVEGWTERVTLEASLEEQLQQFSPNQQAVFYANQGIWEDALTTLGNLYREHPQSAALQADWLALLTSAGLEDIATEGFVDAPSMVYAQP